VVRPGGLGYMGKQARRSAKAIARELRKGRSAEPALFADPTRPAVSRRPSS
jgi:hypothetical protein